MEEQQQAGRREREKLALGVIASLKEKIASGVYPLEEQKCFCGADNDKELITHDRIGLPHRIVICQNCALVRANPRMTAEAYRQFYNDEYRDLPLCYLKEHPEEVQREKAILEERERNRGVYLRDEMLVNEDIPPPKVVVDFGCYQGGMLDAFRETGAETWGIEINEDAAAYARTKGHKIVSRIEELIMLGVKADLVIMQDVIEHLLDLREVQKVGQILSEEGCLYVWTPGIFRTRPEAVWQLAHTYYFVANTLKWVMGQVGFAPTYIDEDIGSFWKYDGLVDPRDLPPQEWVEYITDEAEGKEERKMPRFGGICKFTKKLLYENMRANFSKGIPDLQEITNSRTGSVIIVGGGPSVDGKIAELRNLHHSGVPLIAISRMYPWCLKNDIRPNYVVSLDCSKEQEAGFVDIQPETTHLMASVTRPEIVDLILEKNAKVYLFDSRDDRKIKALRREAGYQAVTVVNGGGSVTVLCISLALNLGFQKLHIFGFDCMLPSPEIHHAADIAGESVPLKLIDVTVNGENLTTTPSFLEFAGQALDLFSVAHEEGMLDEVKVYGDSLINRMWNCQWIPEEVQSVPLS